MKVAQIYDIVNTITKEVLGETAVVNEDLSNYAKKIEEPTLLIWGDKDTAAPVEDARVLEKIMIDANLIDDYVNYNDLVRNY